jgi:hypothetical protein
LVPSAIAALGDSGSGPNLPILLGVGGLFIVAGTAVLIAALRSNKTPSRATSPSLALTYQRRTQQKKAEKRSKNPGASGISEWFAGTAVAVSYRERRSRKRAEKKLQRRIKERRRQAGH